MSDSLVTKLDLLHEKVSTVTRLLADTRYSEKKAKEQVELLSRENERLRKKLEQAQGQVNQLINQWFPELELELNAKDNHGNA